MGSGKRPVVDPASALPEARKIRECTCADPSCEPCQKLAKKLLDLIELFYSECERDAAAYLRSLDKPKLRRMSLRANLFEAAERVERGMHRGARVKEDEARRRLVAKIKKAGNK